MSALQTSPQPSAGPKARCPLGQSGRRTLLLIPTGGITGTLQDYLGLLQVRSHRTYAVVIASAWLFRSVPFVTVIPRLVVLFFCFGTLYGGLYTVNGIADRAADRLDPRKRGRPMAAGRICLRGAWIFACALIASGLAGGWLLLGPGVAAVFGAFIALNLSYTYLWKHVPYVEFGINALMHVLRCVLGVLMARGAFPWGLLAAYFLFFVGNMAARRLGEKRDGYTARRTLSRYSARELRLVSLLCGLGILALCVWEAPAHLWLYLVLLAVYVPATLGAFVSRRLHTLFQKALL